MDPYKDKVVLFLPMEGAGALATDNTVVNDRTGRTVTNARSTYGYLSNSSSPPWGRDAYVAKDSYLWVADSSAWNFGTGDFTVECWVRFIALPALGSQGVFAAQYTTTGNQRGWQFGIYTDSGTVYKLRFIRSIDGTYSVGLAHLVTWGVSVDTWYHVAVTRRSGYLQLWVDGAPLGSAVADSNTYFDSTAPLTIGAHDHGAAVSFLDGYIKDLRITKGIARYTGNFTPSQTTTVDDADWASVVLGIHGEGSGTTFTDVSNNAKTITTVGNTTHSTAVAPPFGTSSIYFDGTGDYLTVPDSADFTLGAGDFTLEAWVYRPSGTYTEAKVICGKRAGSGTTDISFVWYWNYADDRLHFDYSVNGSTQLNSSTLTSATIPADTWTHTAFVRRGAVGTFFVNGVADATTVSFGSNAIYDSACNLAIGGRLDGLRAWLGYIKDLRITKGVARYTQDFIPKYRPFPDKTAIKTIAKPFDWDTPEQPRIML